MTAGSIRSLWDCFDEIAVRVNIGEWPDMKDESDFLRHGLTMLCSEGGNIKKCQHLPHRLRDGRAFGMLSWRAFMCEECVMAVKANPGKPPPLVGHDQCDTCLEETVLFFPLIVTRGTTGFLAEVCAACRRFVREFVPDAVLEVDGALYGGPGFN